MKKITTFFLLIVFVFQSTSNFWIITSFYINQDYIAENICINRFDKIPVCYGKCYLSKQLRENDKKEQKLPNIKEKEIQLFYYHDFYFTINKVTDNSYCIHYPQYRPEFFTEEYLYSVFHPPKQNA